MSAPVHLASPQTALAPDAASTRITLPETPACYRPRTAAEMTHLSRPLIASAIKKGELRALKIGGAVVIPRQCLETWINERAVLLGRTP